MKICLIHNRFGEHAVGGAERVVLSLAQTIQTHGHDVFVITTGKTDRTYTYEGITVYTVHQDNRYALGEGQHHGLFATLQWHRRNLSHAGVEQKIKTILETEHPDVVHTHNLMGLSLSLPKMLAKLASKHIHTLHDVQLLEPSGIMVAHREQTIRYHNPLSWLYRRYMATYFGSVKTITAPSQRLLDRYQRYGLFQQTETIVVRHANTKDATFDTKKSSTIQTVGYIGQLEYHKGIDVFLTAVTNLNDIAVRIAGDGGLRSLVEEAATKYAHVTYDGKLTKEQVTAWYQDVDLVVIPSRCIENAPNIIFECAAAQVPLIVSSADSLPEFIEDMQTGLVFETNNIQDLHDKISYAIEHATDMQTYAQAMLKQEWGSVNDYLRLYER